MAETGPLAVDDLALEPVVLTGALVGYGRVSTAGQNLDRQRRALQAAGCGRVFTDTGSGRDAARPQLGACRDYLRLMAGWVIGTI